MQEKNNGLLLISIVMPIYNAEKYLDTTIKCVMDQTYPQWELILVDDCSKDSSLEICKRWAAKDCRIQVIAHEQNMGILQSRLDGICIAKGDYIGFVDSDDLMHPQMYEILASAAIQEQAGIIMCDSVRVSAMVEVPLEPVTIRKKQAQKFGKGDSYQRMFGVSGTDWQYLVMWNKIYRSEIAKSIKVETRGSDDAVFNCTAIRLANGITKLNTKPLYFWVQHPVSSSHSKFNKRNVEVLKDYFNMSDEIALHDPSCFHSAAVKTFKVLLYTRYDSRKTDYSCEVAQYIYLEFPKFYKKFWNCKEISLCWKCVLSIFYYCPFTYNLFRAFCG